jgi:hypothetical protein
MRYASVCCRSGQVRHGVAMKAIEAKRDLVKDLNEGNLAVAKEANKPQLSQQVLGLMEKYLTEGGLTVDQAIEKAEATVKRLQGLQAERVHFVTCQPFMCAVTGSLS